MSKLLLDSNIIIYLFKEELDDAFLIGKKIAVSEISILEVLGFHGLEEIERKAFEKFFQRVEVIKINSSLIRQAVEMRQQKRMSVGDAIIAASAKEEQIALCTRNSADFKWIEGLSIRNPFKD